MKNILVTGVNSEIPKQFVYEAAKQGFRMIVGGKHLQKLENTASDILIRHEMEVDVLLFDPLDEEAQRDLIRNMEHDIQGIVYFYGEVREQREEWTSADVQHMMNEELISTISFIEKLRENKDSMELEFLAVFPAKTIQEGAKTAYLSKTIDAAVAEYVTGLAEQHHTGSWSVIRETKKEAQQLVKTIVDTLVNKQKTLQPANEEPLTEKKYKTKKTPRDK